MKIYLDACCYNRPFDDQTQERIRLETISITYIFNRIDIGLFELLTSDVLEWELNKNPDDNKKLFSLELLGKSGTKVLLNDKILIRSKDIEQYGFKAFDSLHIAISEFAGAIALLTTDKKMIALAKKKKLKIKVINPIDFFKEYV